MAAKTTVQAAIAALIERSDLSREMARSVMADMMDGLASPAQIGSLLTALRMKGETVEEVAGFAEAMRSRSSRVETTQEGLLDTCGTGGDGSDTFNISTVSSIVAAAGGIRIAKHGNRAMSSKSGSADVLEALGVKVTLGPIEAAQCLDRVGLCFMFAQVYHQSMKHAAQPRRELGIRTVFNLLGPLTNPAGADRQLMGVFDRSKTELVAQVMRELGLRRAMVVASEDGLDEISIAAPTKVTELDGDTIRTYRITPDDLGLRSSPLSDIIGGTPADNAEIIRHVLAGAQGAQRDVVLANAGACFYIAGMAGTLQQGVKLAADAIDSGRAAQKLALLVQTTEELAHVSG